MLQAAECLKKQMGNLSLPNSSQRITIVGKTGSGKTVAAAWQLSERDITSRPWVVFDFKGDDLLGQIEYAVEWDIRSSPPKRPGVYIVRPLPSEVDEVENFLWEIWRRGNTGVYIDEGYMINRYSKAFQAILTQGRSKRIPMIVLTQRPVATTRFLFSEADFFQIFWLNHIDDRKTVQAFTPIDMEARLPEFHSYWYDVKRDRSAILGPVPSQDEILNKFDTRLKRKPTII